MSELGEQVRLPRLLDLNPCPPLDRRRQYWRYVHRWRKRLFHLWCQDMSGDLDEVEIARGVDDLLGTALLLDYFHRSGLAGLPLISEVYERLAHPTVSAVASAIAATAIDPFVSAALDSAALANTLPVPRRVIGGNWQRRLKDATWLLYRDRRIPLSLFGEYHQVCTGNPLKKGTSYSEGKGKRRSRGMFYTPAPIVDYLVATTLAPVLAGRRPEEIAQLRLLDPSCGCGAFLIASFRYILFWLSCHPACDNEAIPRLSLDVIKHVLHGCDIDYQAVRWTIRLQLLTAREVLQSCAVSQGTEATLSVSSLQNTICCKSFLGASHNPKSAPSTYDVVLGGPPFVRFEQLHHTQRDQLSAYRRRYLSARHGQYDLYMLFIERAIDLLREGGRIGFSLSNSFLRTDSGRTIRGYIAANAAVEEIVEFEDPRTYDDAATQIALLRLRKARPRCVGQYAVITGRGRLRHKLEHLAAGHAHPELSIRPLAREATASSRWNIAAAGDDRWLERIQQVGIPLGKLATIESGPSTGMDRLLLFKSVGRRTGGRILLQSRDGGKHTIEIEEAAVRSVVRGHQLQGYGPPKLQHVYPFPYDSAGRVLPEDDLRTTLPFVYGYLLKIQDELAKRTLPKGYPWYATFLRKPPRAAQRPRLMSAKVTSGGRFSLVDDSQLLAHSSVVVIADRSGTLDPYYLLEIVNSRIFVQYISLTMPKINVGRYSLRLSRLRRFPMPNPASEYTQQVSQTISLLVRDLLHWSAQHSPSQESLAAIDHHVASLYGVTS